MISSASRAISADEWLDLCTATKLISPDPMLLLWRSDLNLNIFMCNTNLLLILIRIFAGGRGNEPT